MATEAQVLNIGFNANLFALDPSVVPNEYAINVLRDLLYKSSSCFYNPFFQVPPSGTIVSFPSPIADVVWVLNRSATGNSVKVSYTAAGEATQSQVELSPGGLFLYINPHPLTGGIASMVLTADSVVIPCEVLFAGGATSGQAAATITATSGSGQSIQVGTAAPGAFVATVLDSTGTPVGGITVTFTAPSSGPSGSFAGAGTTITAITGKDGVATAPSFTANGNTGSYNVTASVSGVSVSATFSLTNAQAAPVPTTITATGGSGQTAAVSTAFTNALQATVRDQFGNSMSGITVTFTAPPTTGASGTFANGTNTTTAVTDSSGIATASTFTADATVGAYNVTASM